MTTVENADVRAGVADIGAERAVDEAQASSEGDGGIATEQTAKYTEQIRQLEIERDRAKSDKDKTLAELNKLREENQPLNANVLAKLTDAVASKGEDSSGISWDEVAKELDNADGKTLAKYLNQTGYTSIEQAKQIVDARLQEERDAALERQKELEARLDRLSQKVEDSNDEYVARKEHVAELAEKYGMDLRKDRERLLAISKDVKPELSMPAREIPPGSSAPTVPAAGGGATNKVELTPDIIAFYQRKGITDEKEMIEYEKRHLQRDWRAS